MKLLSLIISKIECWYESNVCEGVPEQQLQQAGDLVRRTPALVTKGFFGQFYSAPAQVKLPLSVCSPYVTTLSISFEKTQVDNIFGPSSVTFGSPLADVSGLVKPFKLGHRNTNEDTPEVGGDDFDLDEVDSDHGHQ